MKLTLKCLIDFRSWLGEDNDMIMWELDDLPEFVQNAYYMEFLGYRAELDEYISGLHKEYNNNFQKELDEIHGK